MKNLIVVVGIALAAAPAWAQCHKLAEVNTDKSEGQLLQQAGQESDAAKKNALLEQFATQFPQNEATGWVYEQLLASYAKDNQVDKALGVADKLAAIPPECVETAQ